MDSNIHNHHHHHHHHNQHQQQQQQQEHMNSGLTRYRSAPSSYFSNLINSGVYGDEDLDPFFTTRISSPETETGMSRFMSTGDHNLGSHGNLEEFQVNYPSQQMMYPNKNSNLVRQSSSPAGFLEQNNVDNGYPMMNFSSASRLLTCIPEHNGKTVNWGESSMLADGFLNEFVENSHMSSSGNQEKMNDGGRIQSTRAATGLTHQLSLPTSSTELSVKEKLLQFQDNVPLRSRAKRGCATHPRSIAERVRRTRISERMRKLQDLVPNMDKQTSTADMLGLAVDYIKELQNQVETLSDRRTKCTCSNKLKL